MGKEDRIIEKVKLVSIVINLTDMSRSFVSPPSFFLSPPLPLLLSEDWRVDTASAPALHLPPCPPPAVHGAPPLPAGGRTKPTWVKGADDNSAAALPPEPPMGKPRRERGPSNDAAKPSAGWTTAKIEMVIPTMAADRPGDAVVREILRRQGAVPRSPFFRMAPSPDMRCNEPERDRLECQLKTVYPLSMTASTYLIFNM